MSFNKATESHKRVKVTITGCEIGKDSTAVSLVTVCLGFNTSFPHLATRNRLLIEYRYRTDVCAVNIKLQPSVDWLSWTKN